MSAQHRIYSAHKIKRSVCKCYEDGQGRKWHWIPVSEQDGSGEWKCLAGYYIDTAQQTKPDFRWCSTAQLARLHLRECWDDEAQPGWEATR